MFEIKVIDNEDDKNVYDVFADEVLIGKILKSFYKKKKISFPGKVKDLEEARGFFHDFEKARAKNYVLFLLSKQNYHSLQLKSKMREKLISEETIQKVLEEVFQYIDDKSYIEIKIEQEVKKGNSPLAIQKKLYSKGISLDLDIIKRKISKEILKDKIFSIIERKFAVNGNIDVKRAFIFLTRKGFEYQDIREVISKFHLKENQIEGDLFN